MKPIYSTSGDWVALLEHIYIYDTLGEWIAWLDGKDVFNRDGAYVGYLSDDGRVLRPRVRVRPPLRTAPQIPFKVRPPSSVPLAPMFSELPWNIVDVFEEEPEVFKFVSEQRPDWEG